MSLYPSEFPDTYAYLMQFEDRNRIDLTLVPLEILETSIKSDKLIVLLLDKDKRIAPLPPSSDEDYHVKKPSAVFYDDCCNEFWWVATYVVKGLYRHEFLYAASALNSWVREQLLTMLSWQAGIDTNFSLSVGKSHKYLDKYLPEQTGKRLLSTFKMDSEENLWAALNETIELFRESSKLVGSRLGYTYPDYDEKVTVYIERLASIEDTKPSGS
jgi:aminoglycoside 6-adenylyltransferase